MPLTVENKRSTFGLIKNLIRFTDMLPADVGAFSEIEHLLEPDELISLFFHLFDKTRPLAIEYESPRTRYAYSVQSNSLITYGRTQDQLTVTLSEQAAVDQLDSHAAGERNRKPEIPRSAQ